VVATCALATHAHAALPPAPVAPSTDAPLRSPSPARRRTLQEGLRNPTGLAVDSVAKKVFWTDWGNSAITRCDLLQPDMASATTRTIGDGLFGRRMNDGPWGLAIDPATGTLVWSEAGGAALRCADYDGSSVSLLSDGDRNSWSATGPWGLALQMGPADAAATAPSAEDRLPSGSAVMRAARRVFWTSWGRIQKCDLSTGRVEDVVRGLVDPTGLVFDEREDGRLFWTDAKAGKVQCAALDGTRVCDVATGLDEPFGLVLGPTHLFWTDRRRGAIQSCCLRTGAVRDVITGLCAPEGIGALTESAPLRVPVRSSRASADATAVARPQRRRQQPQPWRRQQPQQWWMLQPHTPQQDAHGEQGKELLRTPSAAGNAHSVVRSRLRVAANPVRAAESSTRPLSVQELMKRSASTLREMQQQERQEAGVGI